MENFQKPYTQSVDDNSCFGFIVVVEIMANWRDGTGMLAFVWKISRRPSEQRFHFASLHIQFERMTMSNVLIHAECRTNNSRIIIIIIIIENNNNLIKYKFSIVFVSEKKNPYEANSKCVMCNNTYLDVVYLFVQSKYTYQATWVYACWPMNGTFVVCQNR